MTDHSPPNVLSVFLRWFCHPDYLEDIEGDMEEKFFHIAENKGRSSARRWYFLNILKLIRPNLIRPFFNTQRFNQFGMFNNYLTISLRNIKRQAGFSFLNIAGLSIGMACCILIFLYVSHENAYDSYHSKHGRIYRVLQTFRSTNEGVELEDPTPEEFSVWGNARVGPALLNDYPQIEKFTRFTGPQSQLVSKGEKRFQEKTIWFADSSTFEIFDWELIRGDRKTALSTPGAIVLTETFAKKYFDDLDPMGQTLLLDNENTVTVTGLMKDVPSNSHLQFDALISQVTNHSWWSEQFEWWGYVDFYTYVLLKEGANQPENITDNLDPFYTNYVPTWEGYKVDLEPLDKAYLESSAGRQPAAKGNLTNIYALTAIAAFILLIAVINFMNLSSARSLERAKEVSVRKVIGSSKESIIYQFILESLIITCLSAAIAVVMVIGGLPLLSAIAGKTLDISFLLSAKTITIFVSAVLFVGILAGSYPAILLSRFEPVKVLKGSFKTSTTGVLIRKGLVIVQFSLSILLIVGTLVVYQQLSFLKNHELGYQSDQVLVIDYGWDPKVQDQVAFFKDQLLNHRNVLSVSASRAVPGDFLPNAGTSIMNLDSVMYSSNPGIYEIDADFIPTYEIELVAGRNYIETKATDSLESLILNEAAAKDFGFANPEDIIGKKFEQWGRTGKVIGVVKNFNFKSLHDKVEPLSLRYAQHSETSRLSLRLSGQDLSTTVAELSDLWNQLAPHRPFLYTFLDDAFNDQYQADDRFGNIFGIFTGLAIFIACIGLLGLTIYHTAQRTKEIGIRKVMGASANQIVQLLSLDFIKLYGIALLIGMPLAWYLMNKWLSDFAYRVTISWSVFVLAALITLIIALVTMSIKTVQAALSNPTDSLRDE